MSTQNQENETTKTPTHEYRLQKEGLMMLILFMQCM